MRTITKQDCRVLASIVKPRQLGSKGGEIYSRLFQEAYGVPFEMLSLLRDVPMTIETLEKKLEMSRRTVFRYLVALEKLGCKVELSEDGYRIQRYSKSLAPLMNGL